MMFKKFTAIGGKKLWLNIDHVEVIQDYPNAPKKQEDPDAKYSMIYIHTDHREKAYVVKGEADDIVSSIYNSKWRWTGNGT